jgi:hypothetical protein
LRCCDWLLPIVVRIDFWLLRGKSVPVTWQKAKTRKL